MERIKCLEKALQTRLEKAQSQEEFRELEKPRREAEILKEDELPRLLTNAACEGKIILHGEEISLDGKKKFPEISNHYMKELVEDLFTEYHHAAFRLEKDEHIGAILTWQGGQLPKIYSELKLIDDHGIILTDRTVASRILSEIRRRIDEGFENTGAAISDRFEAPPYGWDPRIVRLVLATLFRNGSVLVELHGKEYASPSEPGAAEAFINSRAFDKARFSLGEEITPEQREEARKIIAEVFGESTGHAIEEIDSSIKDIVKTHLEDCTRLSTIASTLSLPTAPSLASLQNALKMIDEAPTRSRQILTFLKEDTIKEIRSNIGILRKMVKFEKEKGIDSYKDIQYFAKNIAGHLIITGAASQDEVDSLNSDLASKDLIDRWPEILSKFRTLREKYFSNYSSLHKERKEKVSLALASLKHTESKKKGEEKNIFSPLTSLLCKIEGMIKEGGEMYVCNHCKTQLSELKFQLEVIENRKGEIKRKLDSILRPQEKEAKGFKESKEIKSSEDMRELTDRMLESAEKAIAKGKNVRVDVKLEVK